MITVTSTGTRLVSPRAAARSASSARATAAASRSARSAASAVPRSAATSRIRPASRPCGSTIGSLKSLTSTRWSARTECFAGSETTFRL